MGKRALYSTGSNSTHKSGWYRTLPNIKPTYVSFRVGTYTAGGASGYVLLGPNTSQTNQVGVFFFMSTQNTFYINGTYLSAYVPQKMYAVRLQFDWTTKRVAAVYIDNVLVATNIQFIDPNTNDIGRVDLYNFLSGASFYDDIRFYD